MSGFVVASLVKNNDEVVRAGYPFVVAHHLNCMQVEAYFLVPEIFPEKAFFSLAISLSVVLLVTGMMICITNVT